MLLVGRSQGVGAQDEWQTEDSWRRVYCALNESLTTRQLKALVLKFIQSQGPFSGQDYLEQVASTGATYAAVAYTLAQFVDGELRWTTYVRTVIPRAPANFTDIGRMANAPKGRPSGAPERRINVRGPEHHQDERHPDEFLD